MTPKRLKERNSDLATVLRVQRRLTDPKERAALGRAAMVLATALAWSESRSEQHLRELLQEISEVRR